MDADERYEQIRAAQSDVAEIADQTGFKAENVEIIKAHLFLTEHILDMYVDLGIPAEIARFDASSAIADAWDRLRTGRFTPYDIQLMRHEMAEAWVMRHVTRSYRLAHLRAQKSFPAPEFIE